MPATEETYRSQPTLHIVFAISSIAMTLSIVWMIMADHLRPWKQVQREFHDGRARQARRPPKQENSKSRRQKAQAKIEEIDAKIKQAEQERPSAAADLRKLDKEIDRLRRRPSSSTPSGNSRRPSSTACAASTTA